MKSNRDQLPPIQAKSVRHRAEANRQCVANASQIGRNQSWQWFYGTGKLRTPARIRARPGESQIDNAVPALTRPWPRFRTVFGMKGKYFHDHQAVQPPSTGRLIPVTYEDASEARKRSGPSISCGSPVRAKGVLLRRRS